MIPGVAVHPLRRIRDERGMVLHMMRCDSPWFRRFGEVYFSRVEPGAVKAWKRHARMTQNLAVPEGRIRLVLFDGSRLQELETGGEDYALVQIPPGVWYGFQALGAGAALIANCPDLPHDPAEIERLAPDSPEIPYRWAA